MTTQEDIADAVAAISPRDVYDRISTISPDVQTWPDQCCQCPLYAFFTEEFPDETIDLVHFEEVCITDNDGGECIPYNLPPWMNDYQEDMCADSTCTTMGRAVAILERYL